MYDYSLRKPTVRRDHFNGTSEARRGKAVVFWLEGKLGSGTDEKSRKGESVDFWNVDQRYGKRLHLVRVRVLSPATNRQLCRLFAG